MCLICFLKCPMQFQMTNCLHFSPMHSKFPNWNKFIKLKKPKNSPVFSECVQVHKIKTARAYIIMNCKGNSHEKMSKEFFQITPLIHLVSNYIWPNSILLQVFPIHNTISSWSLNNKPPKDQKVCFLQKDKDLWDTNRWLLS